MQMLITEGLGSAGDGSNSAASVPVGLGSSGLPTVTPGCLPLEVVSVTNFATFLLLTFSAPLVVNGPGLNPSNFVFTGPNGTHGTRVEVLVPGHLLKVYCTSQKTGGSYTITLPTQGITDESGNVINGIFTWSFTGIGIPPWVQIAKSVDERTLDLVFSVPVLEADAVLGANYSISPSLVVRGAKRITDYYYRLTTGPQTIGQTYQVSTGGIRDINGNS